ncbi:DUF967 domain protein [Talaromyces stipitatus ATCC 10500]|uniref:DUF967 domain protein n=1 Tax=Talaromyces stipitatus (strain ATCC 10500 / CBS 375.48 / QM 6759 / NRRL 1006) TaxID=441959 RepID=B8LYI8_TALSN|nr:DUF967 domain protein [Talaromyces stipitatus ATCC 10500]XP_002340734.1 DUF967 domain protein [Talaromyces stipitatus ATCC 10500]EED23346.1 DUF967 domain protein [Talaromyces stipitatus ATCC 10500]EED23347.1 DUF967 domain protein [Talaromyces stipitatus ATCC 10500]
MASSSGQPLGEPSTDFNALTTLECSYTFPTFNASVAFDLGIALRNRILSLPSTQRKPAVISISTSNGNHILFQSVTESGTTPDNEEWVRRKRNTVLRFGSSTWAFRQKFLASSTPGQNVEALFAQGRGLKSSVPGGVPDDYAIHGGGFPIRVANVDQVVGVVVVSGLKQEHDHQVIVEVIKQFLGKN